MHTQNFPAWFYGPNGESQIFQSEGEIPSGWQDHPSKHEKTKTPAPPAPPLVVKQNDGTANPAIDAAGWPFDPALHAATATRTKEDLWRMKVGVKRPDPKPGFPKPVLDL